VAWDNGIARMNLHGWTAKERQDLREALQAGRPGYLESGQGEKCDELIALTLEVDRECGIGQDS
jgi:hypothetical protein